MIDDFDQTSYYQFISYVFYKDLYKDHTDYGKFGEYVFYCVIVWYNALLAIDIILFNTSY